MAESTSRRWLQAGLLAAGMGAALVGGTAVASAAPSDDAADGAAAPASSRSAGPSRAAARATAVRPATAVRAQNRPAPAAGVRTPNPAMSTRTSTATPATSATAPARRAARTGDRVPAVAPRTSAAPMSGEAPAASPSAASVAAQPVPSPATVAPRLAAAAPAPAATASPAGFSLPIGPIRAALLAAQAYIYGYPLMEYERVRAEAPSLNTMINLTTFANPDVAPIWRAIGGGKRPNVDTFYSLSELDLTNGPVVLTVPAMGSRYYSFQLTDPYTNVTGYIGSRTYGPGPGQYAITWTGGPSVNVPGATVVEVPYASMMLLGRTLAGDAADQQQAISLIDQYTLTPTGVTGPNNAILPANDSGIAYLNALSDALTQNPPPPADADILARIARIGVGPGLQIADANLGILSTLAVDIAVKVTAALLPTLAQLTQWTSALQNHGWAIPKETIGNFGTDYVFRAGVAEVGLVANTQEEAMYEAGLLDSWYLPLNGFLSSYTLHFDAGQLPPADAFWSITVYDAEGKLVPNSDGRYSVSNSRPGELVYRPDGSLDIVFSKTDPGDPTANWLAIPAGGFSAYLRMYGPQQTALDRVWVPPAIERRSFLGIRL